MVGACGAARRARVAVILLACLLLAASVCAWPGRGGAADDAEPVESPRGAAIRRWWRRLRRDSAGEDTEILVLVEGLAAGLEAGLTPVAALVIAARGLTASNRDDPDSAGPVARAVPGMLVRARTGDGLGSAWSDLAEQTGLAELRLVARSWSLSETTGAPLAHAARTAARLVRENRDQRRRAATAVAGAKATMTILTLLPLGGPVLAAVMGIDLLGLYTSSPLVWFCLAAGIGLVVVGRWWVRRLVVVALRGPVLT